MAVSRKWVRMRVGNKHSLLRLLDSSLGAAMDLIISRAHEDGTWISSRDEREYFQARLNISPPTFHRYVKSLSEKGILVQQPGRGIYRISKEMIEIIR